MIGYNRERLHVNHFWELKGWEFLENKCTTWSVDPYVQDLNIGILHRTVFFLEHTSGKVFHFSPTKFCLQAFIFFLQKPKGDPKRIFPHTITIFSNCKVVRKRKNINREIFFELKLNSQCSISEESKWAVQRICIFILGVRWFVMMYYMFLDSN